MTLKYKFIKIIDKFLWIIRMTIRYPLVFLLPDVLYLKQQYRRKMRRKLNLKKPVLYSEKVQWLKLYDRRPEYSKLVDKYEVRKYIAQTIGERYLIPNYGVWTHFDEIPFDTLPNEFVLKCTHDCGSVYICKDKSRLDLTELRKRFRKYLAVNCYYQRKEWVYKNIRPCIIAEKLMIDESGVQLKDYKIYCFNGEPKIVNIIFDRFTTGTGGKKEYFFSPQWEYQPVGSGGHPNDPNVKIQKPKCLEEMLNLARKLSAGKIHVRVDFYVAADKIYFGELTFYSCAGYERFDPPQWDKTFGDWMTLPKH